MVYMCLCVYRCFPSGTVVKNPPANAQDVQETWVQSLAWEDPLEKEMGTNFSILTWKIPWTEESGLGLSPWGHKGLGTDEWMSIHNGILLSRKKNEISLFVRTWMDLEIIIISDVSQIKTNIISYHLYVES